MDSIGASTPNEPPACEHGHILKQGMKGAIDLVDITPIAQGLTMAYQAMEQVKGQIYAVHRC